MRQRVHRLVPEPTRGAPTPVLSAVNPYLPSAGPLCVTHFPVWISRRISPVSILHLTVHMDQDNANGDYADDHRNSRAEERTGGPSPFSGAADRSPVIPPAFPPGSLAHAPHRPHFPGFVPLPRGPCLTQIVLVSTFSSYRRYVLSDGSYHCLSRILILRRSL